MKIPFIASLLLFPCTLLADPVVSLAGIQVVYDSAEKEFDGFKTFNMDPGHKITLLFRSKERSIVGLNEEKASVSIGGAVAKNRFFISDSSFSEDKKTLKLEFETNGKVTADAEGKLEIKGTLPLVFATGKAEVKSRPFQVKKGEEIILTAEDKNLPVLKVSKSGKPQWGDDALEIEFSTDRKMDEYAGIRFTTKDGKEITTAQNGSSWMRFGGKGSGSVTYTLAEKHDELILVLETWTGREEKPVEVDIRADWAVK